MAEKKQMIKKMSIKQGTAFKYNQPEDMLNKFFIL